MKARLDGVHTETTYIVLNFSIINSENVHPSNITVTNEQLVGISTWAQLWTLIHPMILAEAEKYAELDTKVGLLSSKIGQEISI